MTAPYSSSTETDLGSLPDPQITAVDEQHVADLVARLAVSPEDHAELLRMLGIPAKKENQ